MKNDIPTYALLQKGQFADKCYLFYVVELTDNNRFIAGSFDEKHMNNLLNILQNGNGPL